MDISSIDTKSPFRSTIGLLLGWLLSTSFGNSFVSLLNGSHAFLSIKPVLPDTFTVIDRVADLGYMTSDEIHLAIKLGFLLWYGMNASLIWVGIANGWKKLNEGNATRRGECKYPQCARLEKMREDCQGDNY